MGTVWNLRKTLYIPLIVSTKTMHAKDYPYIDFIRDADLLVFMLLTPMANQSEIVSIGGTPVILWAELSLGPSEATCHFSSRPQ